MIYDSICDGVPVDDDNWRTEETGSSAVKSWRQRKVGTKVEVIGDRAKENDTALGNYPDGHRHVLLTGGRGVCSSWLLVPE